MKNIVVALLIGILVGSGINYGYFLSSVTGRYMGETLKEEAFQYLVNSYNATLGLCYVNPEEKNVYWVSHDNVLASHALQKWNREIADNITENIKRIAREYNLTTSLVGIPLDTRAEIPLGYNVNHFNVTDLITLNASYYGSELRSEVATNETLTEFENYADLLCYASLVKWREQNYTGADYYYQKFKAMWDGNGFNDNAFDYYGYYATYKLGLFYLVNKMLGKGSFYFEKELTNRIWKCQDSNGGFKTDYYGNGSFPFGCKTNTETTSIILISDVPCVVLACQVGVKVGAYYYIWWGLPSPPYLNHWEEGIKYTPFLGEYDSGDPMISDRYILWAMQHRIDFFAVSWLGEGTWIDWIDWDFSYIDLHNLKTGFLKAPHLSNFSFCLFYETRIVLDTANQPTPKKNFTEIFINDMIYAAKNYFIIPSYLRVNGRPVLFIYDLPYLYTSLTTPKAQNLLDSTSQLLETMGFDVYLVGIVSPGPSPEDVNAEWLYSMDAVTNYLFAHTRIAEGWQNITEYAETYYPIWRSYMSSKGIKFVPNAYPGFDNTEHLKWLNRSPLDPVLPLNETMFRKMLTTAINYADYDLRMVMITSWNEWFESTAIEPSMEFGELFLHTIYDVVPEFPSSMFLSLFMIATLLTVVVYRRRKRVAKRVQSLP